MARAIWKATKTADVIYAQDLLVVGVASNLATFLSRKPLVVKFVGDVVWETIRNEGSFAGSLEEFYQSNLSFSDKLKTFLQKWVLRSAAKVIVPSKYLKGFLIDHYGISQEKITVIYNGVKVDRRMLVKKDPALVVTVARLVPWKNISGIISAIHKIPGLKYQVIGGGPELSRLEKLVNRLGLEKKVIFRGELGKQEVKKAMGKAFLFILNSTYEGLPHVLLEAALAKNTIIAPALPGIQELFSLKEAWLFEPGGEEKLQQAIKKAVRNKKQSQSKASYAYKRVVRVFSWGKTYRKTEQLLAAAAKVGQ